MSLDHFDPGSQTAGHIASATTKRSIAEKLTAHAEPGAVLMKALSHPGRLMILCYLADGEKSVTELETLLGRRQAAVSQHLARLRLDSLVTTRRDGKAIFYRIKERRALGIVRALAEIFEP